MRYSLSYFVIQIVVASSVKKEGENRSHYMQLFAGFTDDKPVVIGLPENINRFMCEYKPSRLV